MKAPHLACLLALLVLPTADVVMTDLTPARRRSDPLTALARKADRKASPDDHRAKPIEAGVLSQKVVEFPGRT